jgi:hypothetical protein
MKTLIPILFKQHEQVRQTSWLIGKLLLLIRDAQTLRNSGRFSADFIQQNAGILHPIDHC